jgi:hypothetical protein
MLHFDGVLPLTPEVISAVAIVLLVALFYLSFIVLAGMAVSSVVTSRVVALVTLMAGWVIMVVAVPGLAKPISEALVPLKSGYEVKRDVQAAVSSARQAGSDEAKMQYNDPFHENVPIRAQWCRSIIAIQQNIEDEAHMAGIDQSRTVEILSALSPYSLLQSSLQNVTGTGVAGYELLFDSVRRYRRQLHAFVESADSRDPDSPHQLYTWGFRSDSGVFSTKPVDISAVPRFESQWMAGGLSVEPILPIWQTLLLLAANLQMAVLAFIALACYDPR